MRHESNRNAVWTRHILTLAVCAVFAALGTATADGDGGEGGGEGEESTGIVSRIEHVSNLETELEPGDPHAVGPGATEIARAIAGELDPDDSVVVEVLPGEPRRILVIAELPGIDMFPEGERRLALMSIHDAFDARDAEVAIGIKDGLFYKGTLLRDADQWPPAIDTSPSDARGALAAILEPPRPPQPDPAPQAEAASTASTQAQSPPTP